MVRRKTPATRAWRVLIAQEFLELPLRARLLPALPPLDEQPPLFGQPTLVVAGQRVDPLEVAHPARRLGPLQVRPDVLQPLGGDVTVVGPAQDLLHLLDGRVNDVLELRSEAAGKDLHRVA